MRQHSILMGVVSVLALCRLFGSDCPAFAQAPNVPAAQPPVPENPFPDRLPAPDLEGGVEWLNTSGPIELRDLRGKVVLLDFWTYCCINCIHVLPDLKFLEEKYPNELVVIGVHAAKFDNEKETENIREAIMRYEIAHPVVNDADMAIASRFGFSSWPTLMVIDPEGNFVGRVSGEGNRELLDQVVGKIVAYHKAKGTLDDSPVMFQLERQQQEPSPLRYPGKLVVDVAGNRLFISDSNHNRIVIASLEGELIDVIGSGAIGRDDGPYATATFDHPQGMVLHGDTLIVADTENHLLRTVDLAAKRVTTLAGTGKQAVGRDRGGALQLTALNSPWDLCILKDVLYIAMAGPHQLWSHRLGSETIEAFAGSGREDILDGPLAGAALAQPSGITTDGTHLYFVDSEGSAVRVVDFEKSLVTTLVGPRDLPRGRSLFEFGDIDGEGDQARLQHPLGIAFHNGRLYVADTYNDRIKLVDPNELTSTAWLGTGASGNRLDPVELAEPSGLAIGGEWMYIADTNNHRILRTNLNSRETTAFAVKGLAPPVVKRAPAAVPYSGPVTELDAMTLAGGRPLQLTVNFELPQEFKLNELAPVVFEVEAESASLLAEASAVRHSVEGRGTRVNLSLPVAASGDGTLVLTVRYQYCRDGQGGVCKPGAHRWKIPVTLSQGSSALTLTAKPGI